MNAGSPSPRMARRRMRRKKQDQPGPERQRRRIWTSAGLGHAAEQFEHCGVSGLAAMRSHNLFRVVYRVTYRSSDSSAHRGPEVAGAGGVGEQGGGRRRKRRKRRKARESTAKTTSEPLHDTASLHNSWSPPTNIYVTGETKEYGAHRPHCPCPRALPSLPGTPAPRVPPLQQ